MRKTRLVPPQCPLAGKGECKGEERAYYLDPVSRDDIQMVVVCRRDPCPARNPELWLGELRKRLFAHEEERK